MSKHTPGPWLFYELPNGSRLPDGVGYIRPDPEDGLEICHHGDTGRSREENIANAALIEAVLDLLEAAQVARRVLVNAVRSSVDLPEFDPTEHFAVKILDAAIAKATGS